VTNGLKVVNKQFGSVKLVCSGAGASAIACLDLLCGLGLKRENVFVCDSKGVIYEGRDPSMEPNKARYARKTDARQLADVISGADIFLGLSGPGAMKQEWVKKMGEKPIVFALANPTPEILPEEVKAVRPDAIIATGRSDYPNQVNNVLCFPFIFRGALDVGATKITEEMKLACVHAIAELAQAEQSDVVAMAYEGADLSFGPDYIIPKPFDPRLITRIAPAVAKAAMASGVATRPIADLEAYREQLSNFVYQSGFIMKPVFAAAKKTPRRVIYAEGEDERVLRAAQVVVDEKLAKPVLIGRPEVVETRIKRFGLRLVPGRDFELVNPESDTRYKEVWTEYYKLMRRRGVSPDDAKVHVRQSNTLIGAMLLRRGDGDAMLCGTFGRHKDHLRHVSNIIGLRRGSSVFAAMNVLMLPRRTVFISDTYVNEDPTVGQLTEITVMAAEEVRRFGIVPKVALLSHSNFGTDDSASALKMSQALDAIVRIAPELEIDGEMHGDAALSEAVRNHVHPDGRLRGEANLLIMPNLDAANISFNLLKMIGGEGITVGPILLGAAMPVHIMTPSATVRRLVNMTALCSVDANAQASMA
jgi:malate dehydrogenase (oxaloacetate-decarboxylating)(NADP+)